MTNPVCGSCGAPTGDGAALCQGCTRDLGQALTLAASIAPDLDDAVARLMARGDRGPRGSESPMPYDSEAAWFRARLRIVLVRCIRAIGEPPGLRVDGLIQIEPGANWLLARTGAFRQLENAAELYGEVRHAVREAVAVVDRRPERMPAGLCPLCRVELFAEVGADTAACPACGYAVTGIQARRRERAAAADVLGTPGEISGALYSLGIIVSASTIRVWASRGRLAQRPGGVYAMSDVLHVCSQRGARRS